MKWMHIDCTQTLGEIISLPSDLEDPQQSDAPEHWDAKRGHDFQLNQNGFSDSSTNNEAVETVEEGNEVGLEPETVHLH